MRTINATFDDKTFDQIKKLKEFEGLTWEGLIFKGMKAIKKIREVKEKYGI